MVVFHAGHLLPNPDYIADHLSINTNNKPRTERDGVVEDVKCRGVEVLVVNLC
jgi:hypothetical protein